jgi:hypothetical protein
MRGSAATAVAVCAALLLPAAARTQEAGDPVAAHKSEAVQRLFDEDQERVSATLLALEEQDVIRQELSVCIDPSGPTLSCDARLWVESPHDHIRLLLDESLRVLRVRDSRGDTLRHARDGDVLEIRAGDGEERFPLEIAMSYEGPLEPSEGAWVGHDVVALGPGFHWYPVSDARDASRLRVEVRYPMGYSSVASGTLAGMAPSLPEQGACSEGDLWEVPTPVTDAAIVVARLESSLSIVGDVFFGYHGLSPDLWDEAAWTSPSSVPQELIELLRFLETCFGPYPYEWLNVVRLPAAQSRPTTVMVAPGTVIVRDGEGSRGRTSLGGVASGLAHSWWTFRSDPGRLVSHSLATQAEAEWLEATGDEDAAVGLRGLRRTQYMRAMRDSGRGIALRECLGPSGTADERVCAGKGSAVFEMLKSVVGPGAYCAALRALADERPGEPLGLREVVAAFEREHGSDLDWFFYEWVFRSDLPSYAVDYETTPAEDGTHLVRGVVLQEGESFRTPLPLTIDLGGWAYDETVAIESSHQTFEIVTEVEPVEVTIDGRDLIPKVDRGELARLHAERGAAAIDDGRWSDAVDEFGAASALMPRNASYLHQYASALVSHGRVADGLAAMDAIVELDPGEHDVRLEAAGLNLRSGDATAALKHLDAYVAARPRDPDGVALRAAALVELERIDEADAALTRVRELAASAGRADLDDEVLLVTGRILEARGDRAAAIRAYEAALAANPISDEARRRIRAASETGLPSGE